MNYLKKFNESKERDIAKICKEYGIENWSMGDGLVDVDGYVDLSRRELRKLPLKFGSVSGNFYCQNNILTTLEGAPVSIGGHFSCGDNKLLTLEGAPVSVGGYFSCGDNKLLTLEGAPVSVGGYFSCQNNKLTNLEGAPGSVGGNFYCFNNKLRTLEGAPGRVGGDFYCVKNNLNTLEGAPEIVSGDFYCAGNPIYGMWALFMDFKRIEFFNDLDIVRDPIDGKPSFILDRLNFFLETIGEPTIEKVPGWINI